MIAIPLIVPGRASHYSDLFLDHLGLRLDIHDPESMITPECVSPHYTVESKGDIRGRPVGPVTLT